jgi:thioredoxin reductase (NADPH)
MPDFDAIIIGGGPAGLTAGIYLARGKRRTLLIEKEGFGGNVKNIEMVENYPGFSPGVSGAHLAAEMFDQAMTQGLQTETGEVAGIELYSSSKWVSCSGGKGYTSKLVIVATGSRYKKLGVPGEDSFYGKGIINCALCDGGHFNGKIVAVCGGGDTGITEALYMSKIASKVILLEIKPALTGTAVLKERVAANHQIEVKCSTKLESISGNQTVEAIEISNVQTGKKEIVKVDGILVAVGLDPNTDFLKDILPLDEKLQVKVNEKMETEIPGIFAVGDVRHNSLKQISNAVGDGAAAAIYAEKLLQEQG